MLKGISKNFRKPQGFIGSVLLNGMNKGHEKLTKWALSQVEIGPGSVVLDIGCGGGNAIHLMSQKSKNVFGIDYSEVSVKKSGKKNAYAIAQGNVKICQGSVSALPFENEKFDLVTAFETIYFWPDLPGDFAEVCRVVKPGGCFMAVFQNGLEESTSRKLEGSIDGMRIYPPEEIVKLMEDTGFAHTAMIEETLQPGWRDICVIGKKQP